MGVGRTWNLSNWQWHRKCHRAGLSWWRPNGLVHKLQSAPTETDQAHS
jgi:hypothetical protein